MKCIVKCSFYMSMSHVSNREWNLIYTLFRSPLKAGMCFWPVSLLCQGTFFLILSFFLSCYALWPGLISLTLKTWSSSLQIVGREFLELLNTTQQHFRNGFCRRSWWESWVINSVVHGGKVCLCVSVWMNDSPFLRKESKRNVWYLTGDQLS